MAEPQGQRESRRTLLVLAPFDGLRQGGWVAVPEGPGSGFSPDVAVLQRYRRA